MHLYQITPTDIYYQTKLSIYTNFFRQENRSKLHRKPMLNRFFNVMSRIVPGKVQHDLNLVIKICGQSHKRITEKTCEILKKNQVSKKLNSQITTYVKTSTSPPSPLSSHKRNINSQEKGHFQTTMLIVKEL